MRWMAGFGFVSQMSGSCPACGEQLASRHGWHHRHLQDLPIQGTVVKVRLRVNRWRCRIEDCERQTCVDQLPEIAFPHERRTRRVAEFVHLFGHGVGGLRGERLMKRLGMPISDDRILRQLKRHAAAFSAKQTVRVAGIDDWAWRKGYSYGTIVVDLERCKVVDVMQERSAAETANWLSEHPETEIVSPRSLRTVCARHAGRSATSATSR
ncbi:transposase [Methylocystis hirsuta]|uniref:Transposase n=2 Tax=Methylocystis hirsuta TaxID=369798 RepID=A0A3M9XK31_9HYPH|nr:transposase [Methylocystis hirsuta]